MTSIKELHKQGLGLHARIKLELSSYPEKTIHKDGSVSTERLNNPYFLVNDNWNIVFLAGIKQFEEMGKVFNDSHKNIYFYMKSPTIKLEVKYVFYLHLFNGLWGFTTLFKNQSSLKRLLEFLNQKYPKLTSLLDLDIDKAEHEYIFWLNERGLETRKYKYKNNSKTIQKSALASFLRLTYTALSLAADTREEWVKDRWDIRVLHKKFGIEYNKSKSDYYIDFSKIEQLHIRQQCKMFIKKSLLAKNRFSWSTAMSYLTHLPPFLSFIASIEPTWVDLKGLKRNHIEQYMGWLNDYTINNSDKISNPEQYVAACLTRVRKFLEIIQLYEYNIAPETPVRLLIFREDKPILRKKSIDQVDYIPDYVLEQLFTHINDLHKDLIPIIWIAFKTGLRISDVLGLTTDCLKQLNGKYSIMTDIEKTYVLGHRVPIDEELADIIAVLIKQSKEQSNQDNNPDGFIFIRYRGIRKGRTYPQGWVRNTLNNFAVEKNITHENGDLYHFKLHQFRHTYAVKMLNGGADIFTVQELLAHASPEMTMRYAKLSDDSKRQVFESVMSQGVFSFDLNGEVSEIKAGEDIPTDILDAMWQDHKLNAMDNPYGTCHARLNGNCPHMEAPPCLTCNGGSPCKDLAIGFSELDVQKYELHIKTTSKAIEKSKQHGRNDIAEKNEQNLVRYQGILSRIQEGNIIFGRQERMNKNGVKNG